MKHLTLASLLIALFSFTFTACIDSDDSDMVITDYAPITFYMQVNDASGKSLLSPEKNADFFTGTYISYYGKEFPIVDCRDYTADDWNRHTVVSRYYMPRFYGFILVNIDGEPRLYFGEFDGAVATQNESFIIHWADGSTDEVSYSNKFSSEGNKTINTRKYYLNGKELESSSITFIK